MRWAILVLAVLVVAGASWAFRSVSDPAAALRPHLGKTGRLLIRSQANPQRMPMPEMQSSQWLGECQLLEIVEKPDQDITLVMVKLVGMKIATSSGLTAEGNLSDSNEKGFSWPVGIEDILAFEVAGKLVYQKHK